MQLSAMSSHKQVISFILFISWSLFSILSTQVAVADEAFPRATLVQSEEFDDTEYRLVLSGLKRRQTVTSGKVERLLNGDVKRELWQLSSNHNLSQVMDHYLKQWNGEVLYQCDGLDCGSSNFWANKIFNNAKLYGRDTQQSYAVVIDSQQKDKIHVLYAVQRNKQTIFFNIDEVDSSDAVEDDDVERQAIATALGNGSGWLQGLNTIDGRIDEENSKVLIDALKNLDAGIKRRLYLVVHCYHANNMADNFACSTRLSQQLRAAIYEGFEIPVYGHGALTLPPGKDLQPQLRFMLWPKQ
ncbi:MAG: DUF4892 domain-containing protein [Oleispira sp.]|nr:DUF4892 domain-containing protein [Oleispira sp.]MBL4880448.1 DUF4892 domain-containing protein [Oleispira sp.]